MSLYLLFSRWPEEWGTEVSDWVALGLSTSVGAAYWITAKHSGRIRALGALIHLVTVPLLLFGYTFVFIGVVFGDGL
jgi:hypothetical protein